MSMQIYQLIAGIDKQNINLVEEQKMKLNGYSVKMAFIYSASALLSLAFLDLLINI